MLGFPPSLSPPFSLTGPVSERVGVALESAMRSPAPSMHELRDAVGACVDELHALGMYPESALLTMKAFVRHASKAHPPRGRKPNREAADMLMEQIVTWCIKAYFAKVTSETAMFSEVPPIAPAPEQDRPPA